MACLSKGQGAIEYLLIIAAAILVVAIVVGALVNVAWVADNSITDANAGDNFGKLDDLLNKPKPPEVPVETKYSISYSSNTGTGEVPIDSTQYSTNQIATVLGNTGNLLKEGYTFSGWNFNPNGNGTNFTEGSTFAMPSSNIVLYAKWDFDCSTSNFYSGDGSEESPYGICNWFQLDNMRNYLDKHFILLSDLTTTTIGYNGIGNSWNPIGNYSETFSGSFNGNNKIISSLKIDSSEYGALFGNLAGEVKNIGLINLDSSGMYNIAGLAGESTGIISDSYVIGNIVGLDLGQGSKLVGGLVGTLNGGTINNSYFGGTISSIEDAGGLVGRMDEGTISNSYSSGTITGKSPTGGLVGAAAKGKINNSYSSMEVQGTNAVGGLVGANINCQINNSYATGNVLGTDMVGGLIGVFVGELINSFSTGIVTGLEDTGGLVGKLFSGTITNSYYDTRSGQSDTGKGEGRTTEELKNILTFTEWNIVSGETNLNNGYPYLGWQNGDSGNDWIISDYPPITHKIFYNGNGQTSGVVPVDTNSYVIGENVIILGKETLVKTAYTFSGWNTQANGEGINYLPGEEFTMGSTDMNLYAKWILTPTYNITYSGNGNTHGSVPVDSNNYEEGWQAIVLENLNNLSKKDYSFSGWNTSPYGNEINYAENSELVMSAENIVLYAKWISTNTCTLAPTGFTNGDGTIANPYQICNWESLNNMRNHLSSNFILTTPLSQSDLDYLEFGNNWNPIGNTTTPFSGNFNGNEKTISNLKINSSEERIGLFGYSTGNISNIGLVDVNIITSSIVGALAGEVNGTVTKSFATGLVSGGSQVGGLIGYVNQNGQISNSYFSGNVNGASAVGGLIGFTTGSITNSYSNANVTGSNNVGGLLGYKNSSATAITNSFSAGSVTGDWPTGGFIGRSYGPLTNCGWWNGAGPANAIGSTIDGAVVTYSETNKSAFYDKTHNLYDTITPNWDFVNIWVETEEYPILKWQTE